MIHALLVDDEAPARARLRRLLASFADVEILGEASNGVQALEEIQRLGPDVVFLDIEMPELDGIGVASALGASGPAIVFVTAFDEYALKAFEVCAMDYLVKPVTEKRLGDVVEKLRRRTTGGGDRLQELIGKLGSYPRRFAIRSGSRFVVVDPMRISAVLARDHYAAILVDGRELLADDPLDTVAARLDPQRFFRVHRSGVINLDFLRELEREGDRKYTAILSDAARTRVSVSREKLSELKARLGIAD